MSILAAFLSIFSKFANSISTLFSSTKVYLTGVVLFRHTKASFTNIVAYNWREKHCKHFILAGFVPLVIKKYRFLVTL